MNTEGFVQNWCEKGHYYEITASEPAQAFCRFCKAPIKKRNLVDETNVFSTGFIQPVVNKPGSESTFEVLPTGRIKVTRIIGTYKIPE